MFASLPNWPVPGGIASDRKVPRSQIWRRGMSLGDLAGRPRRDEPRPRHSVDADRLAPRLGQALRCRRVGLHPIAERVASAHIGRVQIGEPRRENVSARISADGH